jgi:non-ribosomal peptide synthase protein (TIGR01720 family)
MEIVFNYHGRYQQLERDGALLRQERLVGGESVENVGENMQRFALLDVAAVTLHERTHFYFSYNRHMQHQDKIPYWISRCEQSLKVVVERLGRMETEYTLSDFPMLSLTHTEFQKLIHSTLPGIGLSGPDEVEDVYPCSPMQEGILLSQARASGLYEFRQTYRVLSSQTSETVNIHRLRAAWQRVVDHHASLRTIFIGITSQQGAFSQVVVKHFTADIQYIQCDGREVLPFLNEQRGVEYNMVRPQHRLTLCKVPAGDVFCMIEINHALIDSMSMSLLMRDFALAYEDSLPNGPGPLYSDYIANIQSRPSDVGVEYWKTYLADVEPCHFPVLNDGVDEAKQLRLVQVELEQLSELQKFCKENGMTLFNVLQMAWGLVLRCYTGADEVCFGYLTSGRDFPISVIQDAVGTFVNMLICRMDLVETAHLDKVLDQVQVDFVRSLPHQHCSLAEVHHWIHLSGEPLFNTALSFQRCSSRGSGQSVISFESATAYDPTEAGKPNLAQPVRVFTCPLLIFNCSTTSLSISKRRTQM